MTHNNEQQAHKTSDQSSEGDKPKDQTPVKLINESITDETQAPAYEPKFKSFSSSRDDAKTDSDDNALIELMNRVNAHQKAGENTAQAIVHSVSETVSEFMIEDKDKGVQITARGDRPIAGVGKDATTDDAKANPPRKSFIDGLKAIFDGTSTPDEKAQQEAQFTIEYILRKARETVGSAFDALMPKKSSDDVEKLPYDPSKPEMPTLLPDDPSKVDKPILFADAAADADADHAVKYGGLKAVMRDSVATPISSEALLDTAYRTINSPPYAGESILRGESIEAVTHKCVPGDTLASLAHKHLGPDQSQAKYEAYAREIQAVNHLQGAGLSPGQELVLPGHGKRGSIYVGDGHTGVETFGDGTQLFFHQNGRSFRRVPAADGGHIEYHSGSGQSDEFKIYQAKDGSYSVFEHDGAPEMHASTHPDIRAAHAELHKLADQLIRDPAARIKFEADLIRFENRAQKRGLSDNEVVDTYKSIEHLMEAPHTKIPHGLRIQVAEDILSQAAEPGTICQGAYNTCNAATVEAMLYTKEPAKAAKLVADVAIAGQFEKTDKSLPPAQRFLTIDNDSLQPHGQAFLHGEMHRGYASQIFAVTAVNLVYDDQGAGSRYAQENPWKPTHPGDKPPSPLIDPESDNGERLYDNTGKLIQVDPYMGDDEIIRAHQLITGRTEQGVLLTHPSSGGTDPHLDMVSSEQDLYNALRKYKGKLPIIVSIDTGLEPFFTDSGGGDAGGSGGGHVITVTDFVDGKPPMVAVDNQWDRAVDHRTANVSVRDLFFAMQAPEANYLQLNSIVAHNRKINQIDTATELDLERIQRICDGKEVKGVADMKFGWEVARRYDEAEKRWNQQKANGTFDQAEYDRAQAKLEQLKTHSFSPEALSAFNQGNISDKDRAARVASYRAKHAK